MEEGSGLVRVEVTSGGGGVVETDHGAGRRLTDGGTSGRGESLATISSTSGFFFPRPDSSTSWWLAGVRWDARSFTVVRLTAPEASISRITGKRRAARATSIRLYASHSESPRASRQYTNSDV